MSDAYIIMQIVKKVSHYHRINASAYCQQNFIPGYDDIVFRYEFFKPNDHKLLA